MKDSVKSVLDKYKDFTEECVRITRLLRKNPNDSYDKYILDTFYPKERYKYKEYVKRGRVYTDYDNPILVSEIQGLHKEYGCSWSASFPIELFDMTDDEIISWRKKNLGY